MLLSFQLGTTKYTPHAIKEAVEVAGRATATRAKNCISCRLRWRWDECRNDDAKRHYIVSRLENERD